MEIIHIHGFKCAGTTLEKTLSREWKEILLIESKDSGSRLFFEDIPKNLLSNQAISSHLLSPVSKSEALQVSLIRDPYKRLISAWKFESNGEDNKKNFKEYVTNYKNSLISNYQSKLLSVQKKNKRFSNGWEINLDLDFLFGVNFFLGLVERYDESMVLIEERLKKRGIIKDLSYPQKANTTENILKNRKIQDLHRYSYTSIDCDHWLWSFANKKMDDEIKRMDSFDEKMLNFNERCKKSIFTPNNKKVVFI
jgi:hypothetical protein